jgi:hypothetical protein
MYSREGIPSRGSSQNQNQNMEVRKPLHLESGSGKMESVKMPRRLREEGKEAGEEGKDQILSSPVYRVKQFTLNFTHNYQDTTENFQFEK